ncbi:MAG: hypothetical protein K1W30_01865 [Lachnospiraceae bacterium]
MTKKLLRKLLRKLEKRVKIESRELIGNTYERGRRIKREKGAHKDAGSNSADRGNKKAAT